MPRMHPPEFPIELKADRAGGAEARVFEMLADELDGGYTVFHRVRWLDRPESGAPYDGECDFLIAHPERGLLVLEVKGGRVGVDATNGQWVSVDRDGERHSIRDPFHQANESKHVLKRKLLSTRYWAGRNVPIGHAVVLPDSSKRGASIADGSLDVTLDAEDLTRLDEAIERLFGYWRLQPDADWRAHGVATLERLFVHRDFARVPLGTQLKQHEPEFLRLTQEQSGTLDLLRRASGAFSAIPALRNATGADGVMLVRPFDMAGQGGNCGVGYVGGYGGSPMSAYAELAYAVVSEGNDTKGQPYYCTDTTFAHELGHNMGLMHDRATVASQGGGNGALPYAFGYGKSGQFGTIMSYIHPVVVRFSNPNDTSCNGPCGIDSTDAANSADNARALGITRSAFSAFRATTTQASVSIAGIVTIDGKAAVNVPILAGGTPCATTSSTGAYACTFAAGWSGTVAASAANVTFTPSSQAFSNVQQSASRNFVGVTRTVSITGTATVGGKLASGVTVTAGSTGCGTTTSTGTFACKVAYGWSGSVSATSAAATFTSVALTSVTANRTIQLIGTARPTSFPIKGTVRVNGIATAGVTITANNVTCGTTNAAGAYTCTVAARSSGVLKAAFAGAGFSPSARSYTDIAAAFTQNFEGTRPQVAITGAVTVKGVRRAGVAVQAGGTACGVTNAAGEFACSRPKAWSGRVLAPSISTAMYVDVVNLSAPIRVTLAQR